MAISLRKGGNISLKKADPSIKKALIGLGWDARGTDGGDFDLDASVFLVAGTGKVRSDEDFIFYNQLTSVSGAVVHSGDNLTGVGEGDDEAIQVDLGRVPAEVQKLVFAVTIHDANARRQNFGMVTNAFIRVVNDESDREIVRFDLSEDASIETAMIFGELYRRRGDWKFRAVEQGYQGGLGPLARSFGVNV
ncbi:MAG: TerD family protein [Ardenticatenaceae bacterium]